MAALGSLTGPAGLVTPSFPGTGLGSQPTPGKTGLPGSATGLSSFSLGQQHVRKLTMSSWQRCVQPRGVIARTQGNEARRGCSLP